MFADTGLKDGDKARPKIHYLHTTPGHHIIRILSEKAHRVDMHWVNGTSVQCLGEECPLCENNKIIRTENPDTFREISGYIPYRKTFYINIYDRTPVKICPNCGYENTKVEGGAFPAVCDKCQTLIASIEAHQSNSIKVLVKGVSVFDQFNALYASVLDESGEPVSLNKYDIDLYVQGVGRNTKITAIPRTDKMDVIEYKEEDLYDLENIPLKLSADEILQLQRKVSLQDIFAARRAKETSDAVITDVGEQLELIPKDVKEELNDRINKFF